MKVLVTGGAGFIGSHVCQKLLRLGHSVTVLDELNDFYVPHLKQLNLAAIRETGPITFHELDICATEQVLAVLRSNPPEAIIHLAARAGVRPSLQQPLLYERTNVFGTLSLLEAARDLKIPKFLFASSSSVYGATNRVPFQEDEPVMRPISVYAATKLAGEKLVYTYSHLYGISAWCFRFFTVYGPRQRPDLAIRKFTEMIDRGQEIPVFGDGSSGRDYTYVDDTVDGVIAALERNTTYEIVNLGNSHPVKLLDMIKIIERMLGKQARISWQPDQPGDVPITYADISRAQERLGYSPATPFEEGIGKFIEWYRTFR